MLEGRLVLPARMDVEEARIETGSKSMNGKAARFLSCGTDDLEQRVRDGAFVTVAGVKSREDEDLHVRGRGGAYGSERDGQRAQPPQRQALAELGRVRGERQLRQALHERVDGDLSLETRQRRPQAEVDAPAERDVAVVAFRGVGAGGVPGTAPGAVRGAPRT